MTSKPPAFTPEQIAWIASVIESHEIDLTNSAQTLKWNMANEFANELGWIMLPGRRAEFFRGCGLEP